MPGPNEPIRVLFLSSVPFVGGAEISMLTLAAALPKDRVQASFAVPGEGALADRIRAEGFEVDVLDVPSPNLTRSSKLWTTVTRIGTLLRSRRIDILHNNSFPYLFQSILAGWRRGVPVICHVRDGIPRSWFGGWHGWLARRVKKFLCISRAVAEPFEGFAEVEVIYNGVDASRYGEGGGRLRAEFSTGDAPLIGMVGYLIERKGHDTFLRAAARVLERQPEARFVVIGEDPMPGKPVEAALRAQAQGLGIADNIIWTGYREDAPSLLGDLTALAMPSWNEPWGRVLVEGFAAGVPVIAGNVGGPLEIVEDGRNGLLVPPKNDAALADSMLRLLKDAPLRERLASGGRASLEAKYSPEACARAVLAAYERALA